MSSLVVDISRRTPGLVVVTPSGEADLAAAATLRGALREASDQHVGHVLVDLDGTTFFDGTTLGLLVLAHHRVVAGAGTFEVRCTGAARRRLFCATGLAGLLESHPVPSPAPEPARAA